MNNESMNGIQADCPNILFMTNQCQCKCEYCYEMLDTKDTAPFFAKFSDFKDRIDSLAKNDFKNCMVVFGGEPTLNMDTICEIIDYTNANYPDKFVYYMDTNAILLSDENFFNKYLKYIKDTDVLICAISYDGSVNYRRRDKNNIDTTERVMKAIKNFEAHQIKYNISYTLNYFNYDVCHKDFIQILLNFKHLNRLIISINYMEMSRKLNVFNKTEGIIDDVFREKCKAIYKYFGKPICEMTCDLCGICDKDKQGINYILPTETIYNEAGKMETFNFF